MKTFETEKHNIPEGATHYCNATVAIMFCWFKFENDKWHVMTEKDSIWHDCHNNEWKIYGAKPIPQTKEVEWFNGLPHVGEKVVIRYMHDSKTVCHCGCVLYASESHCILDINGKECHYLMCDYQYEKTETPEAKKEREELEAAYDLRCTFNEDDFIVSFDEFKNHHSSIREKWLKIVRKTGYRKGE